uniref:Uncharacterized protein n=1 Tax=Utricularia reniformis TaxID=192314 RepID=A0A1Y0AZK2_9LAMI|nr:hypothetical protein AEK19_MT0285 [Utricularia reniformis]ART30561.1 hypothetical protein AEK19_MT0285 [Utricularia reniformis]
MFLTTKGGWAINIARSSEAMYKEYPFLYRSILSKVGLLIQSYDWQSKRRLNFWLSN